MDTSAINAASDKRPPGSEDERTIRGETADNSVIPDECGDTLWEDVLAQTNSLATILNKPENTMPDVAAG